jgi:hypothetical protein
VDTAAVLAANADFFFTPHVAGTRYADWFRRNGAFDEIVLIMDCCRSINSVTVVQDPPFPRVSNPRAVRKVYAFAVDWSQEARERAVNGRNQGIFTVALLEALRNAPGDRSGRVTGQRIKDFVHNYISSMPNGDQLSPPVIDVDTFRDIVFAVRAQQPTWAVQIKLDPPAPGANVQVLDGSGKVIEVLTPSAAGVTTQLEAGLYKAEIVGAGRGQLFEVVGRDVEITL